MSAAAPLPMPADGAAVGGAWASTPAAPPPAGSGPTGRRDGAEGGFDDAASELLDAVLAEVVEGFEDSQPEVVACLGFPFDAGAEIVRFGPHVEGPHDLIKTTDCGKAGIGKAADITQFFGFPFPLLELGRVPQRAFADTGQDHLPQAAQELLEGSRPRFPFVGP